MDSDSGVLAVGAYWHPLGTDIRRHRPKTRKEEGNRSRSPAIAVRDGIDAPKRTQLSAGNALMVRIGVQSVCLFFRRKQEAVK